MAIQLDADRIKYTTPTSKHFEGSVTLRQWIHWRRIKMGQRISLSTPDGVVSIVIGDATIYNQPCTEDIMGWEDYAFIDSYIVEVEELF